MIGVNHSLRRIQRDTQGTSMVEFAIVTFVVILFVCGIIDFSHAMYMRYVVGSASQAGARYSSTYRTDGTGKHISPSQLSPSIQDYVLSQYLNKFNLPYDANPQVTVAGTGFTSGMSGDEVRVTVTATKSWFLISRLVPGIEDHTSLSSTTEVLLE